MWDKVRLAFYGTGGVTLAAMLIAAGGAGTFDPATGWFTPHPFNVYDLVAALPGAVAAVTSPFLAMVALVNGWGKRP